MQVPPNISQIKRLRRGNQLIKFILGSFSILCIVGSILYLFGARGVYQEAAAIQLLSCALMCLGFVGVINGIEKCPTDIQVK